MPKVINSGEFKKKIGSHIDALVKSDAGYFIVANGTYPNKSFIVADMLHYADLCDIAFQLKTAEAVKEAYEEIKLSNSERNRRKKLGK